MLTVFEGFLSTIMSKSELEKNRWSDDSSDDEWLFAPSFLSISPRKDEPLRITRPLASVQTKPSVSSKLDSMKRYRDHIDAENVEEQETNHNPRTSLLTSKTASPSQETLRIDDATKAQMKSKFSSLLARKRMYISENITDESNSNSSVDLDRSPVRKNLHIEKKPSKTLKRAASNSKQTKASNTTENIVPEKKSRQENLKQTLKLGKRPKILDDLELSESSEEDFVPAKMKKQSKSDSSDLSRIENSVSKKRRPLSLKRRISPVRNNQDKNPENEKRVLVEKQNLPHEQKNSKTSLKEAPSKPKRKPSKNSKQPCERKEIRRLDEHWRKQLAKKIARGVNKFVLKDILLPQTSDTSQEFQTTFVINDGNSLYRSVSFMLFGNETFFRMVKEMIVEFMYRNKQLMNTLCQKQGYSMSFDNYMRETKADESFRQTIGGFFELEVIANFFKTPVYLFTWPITEEPTQFLPAERENYDCDIVLFREHGYFKPVLQFDGRQFKHVDVSRNQDQAVLANGSVNINISLDTLQSLSTTLADEVIRKGRRIETRLGDTQMNMLRSFLMGQYADVGFDAVLFNFCCEKECPILREMIIRRFKESQSLKEKCSFLHGIRNQAKRYKDELVDVFYDNCFNATTNELLELKVTEEFVREVVDEVLETRRKYVLVTKRVDIRLEDGTFAFADIMPLTSICIDFQKRKLFYYTGPKPTSQKWIELKVNRKFADKLGLITTTEQIQFLGSSVFFWVKEKNALVLYSLSNIFDFRENLNSEVIPVDINDAGQPSFALTEKGRLFLVVGNRLFDLLNQEWLEIDDTIYARGSTNQNFSLQTVTVRESEESIDRKYTFIENEWDCNSNAAFASIFPGQPKIPKVTFQHTIEPVREWGVTRRLKHDNITLDPAKAFEESQQLLYQTVEPSVQYVVPRMDTKNCIYTLIKTNVINRAIRDEFSSLAEFFIEQYDPDLAIKLVPNMGIPLNYYIGLLSKTDFVFQTLKTWFPIAAKLGKSFGLGPRDLLAEAYKRAGRTDIMDKLLLHRIDRKTFLQSNQDALEEIRKQIDKEIYPMSK